MTFAVPREVRPDPEHAARTLRAIARALAGTPYYAKRNVAAPAEDAPLDDALGALPLLTRERMRATLPKAWLPESGESKAALASGKIAVVETGIAEARVRILFDAAWWRAQETRALTVSSRAAAALSGELGPYREAVLWVPERGTGSCGSGDPGYEDRLEGVRLHLNSRQDPTFWTDAVMTRMLDELDRHATIGLVGDPFYLDVLARHAAAAGRVLGVRGFVATTRALFTHGHREAIRRVSSAPLVNVFGAREAATMFVEAEDGLLHHVPFTTHVELIRARVPTPGAEDVALVVVTTLDRDVMPLVRYVLGDLVQVSKAAPRFTTVPPLVSVEGKVEDAVVRPDGAMVTPAALDRALAPLALTAYEIVQREPDALELDVVGGSPEAARDAIAPLVPGLRVATRAATSIGVLPNGKYRTTRRLFPLPLSTAFEACEGA